MSHQQIAEAFFWCVGVPGLGGLVAYGWMHWCDARRIK